MRRFLGSLVMAFAALGCSGDGGSGPSVRIANVFVSAPTPTIAVGDKAQFTAVALDSVGNTVTATFEWTSSAELVAIVSNTGLVTGVTAGNTSISAKAGGATGSLSLTVRASANLAVVTMPPGDVFTPFQVTVPVGGWVR